MFNFSYFFKFEIFKEKYNILYVLSKGGNTVTANINVTFALATISFFAFIGAGITQIDFASTNGTAIAVAVPPATAAGVATVTITPGVSIGLVIALGS